MITVYRQRRPRKPTAALVALFERSERTAIQRNVALVIYCPRWAAWQARNTPPPESPFARIKRAVAKA